MIVADILMWFFLIAGSYVVLVSYWLASQALFPEFVGRCALRIRTGPGRQMAVGLAIVLPAVLAGLAALKAPNGGVKFGGSVLLLGLLLWGLVGSAGLAAQVGQGLGSSKDSSEPWRRVLRGGSVLGLTFVLPLLGWFLLIAVLVMGAGAAVLALGKPGSPVAPPLFQPAAPAVGR